MPSGGSLILAAISCALPAVAAAAERPRLTPTGLVHFRPERIDNLQDFDSDADDDDFLFSLRGDAGLILDMERDVRVKLTLNAADNYSLQKGPLDDTVRLHEAWFELQGLGGADFSIKIGRQSLGTLGTGMLLADEPFDPGLSFEAVRFSHQAGAFSSDFWWVQLYGWWDDAQAHPVLFGLWETWRQSEAFAVDAYLLLLLAQPVRGLSTDTITGGARWFGEVGGADYNLELAYQWGRGIHEGDTLDDERVSAHAGELDLGYTFAGLGLAPRLGASVYRASGDSDPEDDRIETFNPLWQDERGRLGNLGILQGHNIQVIRPNLTLRLSAATDLTLAGLMVSVVEVRDPATSVATPLVPKHHPHEEGDEGEQEGGAADGDGDAGAGDAGAGRSMADMQVGGEADGGAAGEVLVAGPKEAGAGTDVGLGGDITLTYRYTKRVSFEVNASVLQPGDYIEANLGSRDLAMRVYVHCQAIF
jgi:hypothetical protein